MEQKRVLWIAAAVGVFLLVVVGTALLISAPSGNTQPSLNLIQGYGNSWVYPNVILSSNSKNSDGSASDAVIDLNAAGKTGFIPAVTNAVISDGSQQSPVTAPAEQNAAGDKPSGNSDSFAASSGFAQTAVTLNVNITPSSNSAAAYSTQQIQPAQQPAAQVPASAGTAPAGEPVKAKSEPVTEKTAAKPASNQAETPAASKTPAPAPAVVATATVSASSSGQSSQAKATVSAKQAPVMEPDNFWVQVASFTGKTNAEDARSALAEQKISGEVFTYEGSNGTLYYRLRVGPYSTKSEAEYWNKIIREIDGISGNDTYVVNSTVH